MLHAERLDDTRGKRTYLERVSRLPRGAMVADADGQPYLVQAGALRPWSPEGYGAPWRPDAAAQVRVLTPRSLVQAIAHGYTVELHASAFV